MWLFTIGLIHTVLGTSVIGNEIAIPTLPVIKIEHPSYIYYLYWVLVGYSIYRYCLHQKNQFRDLNIESMALLLSTTRIGTSALKFIFPRHLNTSPQKAACEIIKDDEPPISQYGFSLKLNLSINFRIKAKYTYKKTKIPSEIRYDFYYLSSFFPSEIYYDPSDNKTENLNDIDTENEAFIEDLVSPHYEELGSFKIWILSIVNLWFSIVRVLSDHRYFDLTLPILCNLSLFIYTLVNYVHS